MSGLQSCTLWSFFALPLSHHKSTEVETVTLTCVFTFAASVQRSKRGNRPKHRKHSIRAGLSGPDANRSQVLIFTFSLQNKGKNWISSITLNGFKGPVCNI